MKKFSIGKLLITILCSVIVSVLCGNMIWDIENDNFSFMNAKFIESMDSKSLIEVAEPVLKQIEKNVEEETQNLDGDEKYAVGIYLYRYMAAMKVIKIEFLFKSALVGIILGMIIYVVTLQKAKGKKLLIELIVLFAILCVLIAAINIGYKCLFSFFLRDTQYSVTDFQTSIYDLESNKIELIIVFSVIALVIYTVYVLYQKRIVKELNENLNKNNE